MSHQEKFQPVKYYVSWISTSRNTKLKNCEKLFFSFFNWFHFCPQYLWHFEYAPSVQTNFYITLSSNVEEHMKNKSSLTFMSLDCFQVSKIWTFSFKNSTAELALKSFSGGMNSAEAPGFGFSNSFLYDLKESRKFTALISWVWG